MGEYDIDAFFPDQMMGVRPTPTVVSAVSTPPVVSAVSVPPVEAPAPAAPKGDLEDRGYLRGLIYASRKGGEGHIVVLHESPMGQAVMCNCPAIRSLNHRPRGCWAMVDAREILGLPPVE
jgi:hypothetical protein